jgi:hypothetical protein
MKCFSLHMGFCYLSASQADAGNVLRLDPHLVALAVMEFVYPRVVRCEDGRIEVER